MQTFSEVIERWPSMADMAADLGVPYVTVQQWKHRGSIPGKRWRAIERAAKKRGFTEINVGLLANIAETDPEVA